MTDPWWVYIIETARGRLYTGITTDIDRRFGEHLAVAEGKPHARGARFFRTDKPVAVVYRQSFTSRGDASREEALIKKLTAAEKRRLFAPSA